MAVLDLSGDTIQQVAASGTVERVTASESINQSDAVFKVQSSGIGTVGTVRQLQNDATDEEATFYGFAMTACKSGGQVNVLKSGSFEMFSTTPFTAGESYYASATPGKLMPQADLGSGDKQSLVIATNGTNSATIIGKLIGDHA